MSGVKLELQILNNTCDLIHRQDFSRRVLRIDRILTHIQDGHLVEPLGSLLKLKEHLEHTKLAADVQRMPSIHNS